MNGQSSFAMKSVVQKYRKFMEKNQDLGSSFAVYNRSLRILDLIGGYEDLEFEQLWNTNTVSQLFSVSNIVNILSIAHLVDQGILTYDDKISRYLPYCHTSLTNTTISDILNHKGKIPHFNKAISILDYRDEPDITFQKLFSQPPLVSNTQIFHKYTIGIIIDAIIRRVDKHQRSLARYFNEEIGNVNQIDMLIGLPRTQMYRTARIYNPSIRHFIYGMGHLDFHALFQYLFDQPDIVQKIESTFSDVKGTKTRNHEYLEIGLSSWNSFSNADSLAKLLSLVFFGTPDLPPILKRSTVQELCTIQSTYFDKVLNDYVTFSKGGLMSLSGPKNSILYGWRDSTGQFLFADLERNISVAYVTNHLRSLSPNNDYIYSALLNSLYSLI